ncbi:uncharacterized protein A4U43_C07F31710 [Asparagus officinalis]|uniref:Maternal effect embryo arrest 22 n=1 Tax=Asparagus officinalis TaxID=4686 RepID=A0A5P1EGP8_ASPOF|nr:uncharacterized protein LOC109847184 isoform X2 [Asparagus officinalis]ONK64943.1 uncharacterized protein A4U43_C07F31710 [Asparagus officinalis]
MSSIYVSEPPTKGKVVVKTTVGPPDIELRPKEADVALGSDSSNPCCAELNKKYLKARSDRNMLKQGLKMMDARLDGFAQENARLKKALQEEKLRGKQEKEEKVEEFSIRQNLESEIQKLKSEMSSYEKKECSMKVNSGEIQLLKARISEGQNDISRLKELLEKEKKKYENEKKKAESEQKKATEAWKLVKIEKNNAEEGRRLAESESKKAEEYKICLEKAMSEVKEAKRKLKEEISKADDARKRIESEKQKTNAEKARADSEAIKANEQKRLMEVERIKANNEKVRANRLSQMLEEEKQRREGLQKKIEKHTCNGEGKFNGDSSMASAKIKLLSKQLKLEKKQARFYSASTCLMIISHTALKSGKSSIIHGFKLQNNLLCTERCNHYSMTDCGRSKPCMGSFKFSEPTRECVGLSIPRSSCTRPTTGIISELESPVGGSDRNKSQSSAICSNTSNSDKRSMDSQERGSIAVTASVKQTKKHANKRPTVMKLSSEMDKTGKNKKLGVVENYVDKTSVHREAGNACLTARKNYKEILDGEFVHASKRRKVNDIMEPVAHNQSHSKIGGKPTISKDIMNLVGEVTAPSSSQGCGISQNFLNGSACFSENRNESCRQTSNHHSKKRKSKHQLPASQSLGQNDTDKQGGKFDNQRSKDPSFVAESMQSSHQLRENGYIELEGKAVSNEQADLIRFENTIRGGCLKLLDLDNDADEERYRMAVQCPLSPTLPDLLLSNHKCVENDAHCVMERGKPGPFHLLDVTLAKNGAISADQCLVSDESMDSLYPTKDPGNTCAVKLQKCISQQGRLDIIEDNPKPSSNHGPLDVEQTSGKSGDNKMDADAESFLGSHKAFPDPNTSRDSLSDVVDKPLTAYDISGSCASDDVCLQSSTGKVDNVIRNASLVENRQTKACELVGTTTSYGVENQIDGEVSASDGTIICKKHVLSAEINECVKDGAVIFDAEIAQQGSISTLPEASKQPALSISCNVQDSSRINHDDKVGLTTVLCCILFPNIKDNDSISRLLHVRKAFSHQSLMGPQIGNVIVQLYNALAADAVLLPEEKNSVFLSVLVCNISNRMSINFRGISIEHPLPYLESFAAQINTELSDVKTKTLLEEICQLDILAGLVEDFLIERKFLVCVNSFSECNDTPSSVFQSDGANIYSEDATIHQFVAGCIILASISVSAERIDFVLEASFRILRMCKLDPSWRLLALHIFASVCGKEFFDVKECSFLIVALRSVVLLLERGHRSFTSISPPNCIASGIEPSFHHCQECPFSSGAVCMDMDKLVTLLLDVLECFVLAGAGCPNASSSVNLSRCLVPAFAERDKESHGQTNVSHVSCCLYISKKHAADLPDCLPEGSLCHFNDIVSLVELVGCYMNWEWIYGRIISRLTSILESCKHVEFAAALFVLMGHLGRFGVDVAGYQEKGIVELRSTLSLFIDKNIAGKMSFPTELAAIGAMLNLLPLSFSDIVGEGEELTPETSLSDHVKLIKRWFSKLSEQQQFLSVDLFGHAKSSESNMR